MLSGLLFAGLTLAAVTTRADFSFLRGVLIFGSLLELGLIVASLPFGSTLGVVSAAAILYSIANNVVLRYRTGQYVAASLSLFAAVALRFYCVLMIVVSLRRRDPARPRSPRVPLARRGDRGCRIARLWSR